MTLAELQNETLSEKNMRLQQERCPHEEVYSSLVWSAASGTTSTNRLCLDCYQSWHSES